MRGKRMLYPPSSHDFEPVQPGYSRVLSEVSWLHFPKDSTGLEFPLTVSSKSRNYSGAFRRIQKERKTLGGSKSQSNLSMTPLDATRWLHRSPEGSDSLRKFFY